MRPIASLTSGVVCLQSPVHADERGLFLKTSNVDLLNGLGLGFATAETFVSSSRKNALRGMHFQVPPYDHVKLVTCLRGRALDVVLDLRHDSPSFGVAFSYELTAGLALWIDRGFAHGFVALEDDTIFHYQTSHVHVPAADAGIHWNSFGFEWPVPTPLVSRRDALHPSFQEFASPF